MTEDVLTIVLSLVGGGALLTFLQFMITRHDEKKGKKSKLEQAIERVAKQVEDLRNDFQEQKTTEARIRILNFSDALRHGTTRSKESYDQCNADIDTYRRYCNAHPDYPNNRAENEIRYIEQRYAEHLVKNDFLE